MEKAGQYRILELLGRGGQAVVYRAANPEGQVFAVKMMTSSQYIERFIREYRLLKTLQHPNLVRVLDSGLTGPRPFFVMELIEGSDFLSYLRQKHPVKDSIFFKELVRLVLELCDALDYIHRMGIIHRDIKPSNILVAENGRPVLMDFGLARQEDSISLLGGSRIAGSLPYMSMEQLLGQDLDRRCDLYALGVILYQAVSGRLPFEYRSPYELLTRLLNHEIQPLIDISGSIPGWFINLIASLIQTNRDERPNSARQITDACIESLNETGRAGAAADRIYPLLSISIGREPERKKCMDLMQECLSGINEILTVDGEAGIGKSHFVHEFVVEARALGFLTCGCSAFVSSSMPFESIRSSFGHVIRFLVEQPERIQKDLLAGGGRILGKIIPDFLTIPSVLQESMPLDLPPDVEKRRFIDHFGRLLVRISGQQPLMIVFEDIHDLDDDTLNLLAIWIQILKDNPGRMVLAMTFRSSVRQEIDRLNPITRLVSQMSQAVQLHLNPFSDLEIREFIRKTDPGFSEDVLFQGLKQKTGGNPLYLKGLLSILREQVKQVDEDKMDEPDTSTVQIPEDIRGVIFSSMDGLEKDHLRLLETVAVAGHLVYGSVLSSVSKMPFESLLDGIDVLIRRGLIQDKGDSHGSRYGFVHGLVQDAVYSRMASPLKRRIHKKLADWYADARRRGIPVASDEIARHFKKAQEPVEACRWMAVAGEEALSRWSPRTAVSYLKEGLQIIQSEGKDHQSIPYQIRFDIYRGLSRTSQILGDSDASVRYIDMAIREAADNGDTRKHAASLIIKADQYVMLSQSGQVESNALEALKLIELEHDDTMTAQCMNLLGISCAMQGKSIEAVRHFKHVVKIARRTNLDTFQASALNNIGMTLLFKLHPRLAQNLLKTALDLRIQCNQARDIAQSHGNLALSYLLRNCLEDAVESYFKSSEIFMETEDELNAATALSFAAFAEMELFKIEKSLATSARANLLAEKMPPGFWRREYIRMERAIILDVVEPGSGVTDMFEDVFHRLRIIKFRKLMVSSGLQLFIHYIRCGEPEKAENLLDILSGFVDPGTPLSDIIAFFSGYYQCVVRKINETDRMLGILEKIVLPANNTRNTSSLLIILAFSALNCVNMPMLSKCIELFESIPNPRPIDLFRMAAVRFWRYKEETKERYPCDRPIESWFDMMEAQISPEWRDKAMTRIKNDCLILITPCVI